MSGPGGPNAKIARLRAALRRACSRAGRLRSDRPRTVVAVVAGAAVLATGFLFVTAGTADAATTVGIDVSHYQGTINWTKVRKAGVQFAFIKATEGTGYKDPKFTANYRGAYKAGVIRGAYHFALPNKSSGAAQAKFLARNGGAWSADSRTLPSAVDLESNPYGAMCYGKSKTAMRSWISDFLKTYRSSTRRYAVIYTTTSWWKACTGNWTTPWKKQPLWLARWASHIGTMPKSANWRFWQYTCNAKVSGISGRVDRNYFNGTRARLIAFANNK